MSENIISSLQQIYLPKLSQKNNRRFPLEFHISKKVRDKYRFDDSFFTLSGDVVLSNFQTVRLFAQRMNEKRDLKNHPEQTIKIGQLNALGLIHEIWHFVIGVYCQEKNPEIFKNGLEWIAKHFNFEVVDKTLTLFVELFPPQRVYQKQITVEDYVRNKTEQVPNTEIATEEIVILSLSNTNPAFLPFIELFDDTQLAKEALYEVFMGLFIDFVETQPVFGPHHQFLIDLLKAPIVASPNCLVGQLEYIRDNWGMILSFELKQRILIALDLLKEEEKVGFLGPGPALVPRFEEYEKEYGYEEGENFSLDLDWMSKVVLMAKNIYVWLYQLSNKYGRQIRQLDQIPDEELDILAKWGFSSLWLIGLWERSPASQRIKQICGNPEAIGSAYSIYDYVISHDLGGESALENLKNRAWQRGIRLAADMVPNHMGIYSKWTIEHPDWFIQLNYPPFPSYNFNGPNLSQDERVGIYLEDGYWSRTDAAVVFKRVDHWTGEVRYIYHGNDGTTMPWNDTAQLNFLREDVREAVIQMILHVARKFPIIRFDAAMTLAKRHYHRLWFPQPGSGGAIPSRAGQGMSKAEFDRVFPKEFWREVVDRVSKEAPNTLLLAEAFWLMEGYFVRTLGMHRVYNSAFMNMLKMEENANYRSVIKNILEFNPQILKRLVNFMNNPDEHTAVAQFGKGDKYFGIAIMMVTMPGLPMFGHGQIEGFTEKYGMEYSKAYWHEEIDWYLVQRHENEVFPLMKKRHLFSEVKNFALYDFYTEEGWVNEDVFAYSNRAGEERALIVYHNKYATAKGWIRSSVAMVENGRLIQKTLAQSLELKSEEQYYYRFRDYKSGLEYIRQGKELAEKGLYLELNAYHYHIFLDFKEVCDDYHGYYRRLTHSLNGRGVPNLDEVYKEIYLEPVLVLFKQIMNPEMLKKLADLPKDKMEVLNLFEERMQALLGKIKEFVATESDEVKITSEIWSQIVNLEFTRKSPIQSPPYLLLSWAIIQKLGQVKTELNYEQQSVDWLNEWLLEKIVKQTFQDLGDDEPTANRKTHLLKILITYCNWFESDKLLKMFEDEDVKTYLNFNWYKGILWLSKEALEELMSGLFTTSLLQTTSYDDKSIASRYEMVTKILQLAEENDYRVKEILEKIHKEIEECIEQ